ncbi:MAG: hypothetical protein ACKO7B_06965, partial [Flavobacteriales bacterium]
RVNGKAPQPMAAWWNRYHLASPENITVGATISPPKTGNDSASTSRWILRATVPWAEATIK